MKLVQYLSCEKFATSTPGQRFNYLKSKDLCIQCLFPGAKASMGKHVDGMCQSVYTPCISVVNEETDDVSIYMMLEILVGCEVYTMIDDTRYGDMDAPLRPSRD